MISAFYKFTPSKKERITRQKGKAELFMIPQQHLLDNQDDIARLKKQCLSNPSLTQSTKGSSASSRTRSSGRPGSRKRRTGTISNWTGSSSKAPCSSSRTIRIGRREEDSWASLSASCRGGRLNEAKTTWLQGRRSKS